MMTFKSILLSKYLVSICYLMTCLVILDAKDTQFSMNGDIMKVIIYDTQILIHVNVTNGNYETVIGKQMPMIGKPTVRKSYFETIILWPNGLKLFIDVFSMRPPAVILQIKWEIYDANVSLRESIDMSLGNWYGGGVGHVSQAWPIQDQPISESPIIPGYKFGNFAELYFLSSSGISYVIEPQLPLFMSLDQNRTLHLRSEFKHPYHNAYSKPLTLEYTVSFSFSSNMLTLRNRDAKINFGFTSSVNLNIVNVTIAAIRKPVWTMPKNNRYAKRQSLVGLQMFAKKMYNLKFPPGYIEILDGWEGCSGNNTFDTNFFKTAEKMILQIRHLAYEVALRVHPFVNCNCQSLYDEGVRNRFFVTVNGYSITANTSTSFSPCSAVIDVTNDDSSQWWADRLNRLTSLGVSRFNFMVGTDPILPNNSFFQSEFDHHPSYFFNKLTTFANYLVEQNRVNHEIDVSFGSQDHGRYLIHTVHHCDLKSLIPSILNLGIVGYPLVASECDFDQLDPNVELFVRWSQINAFLPVLKFSLPKSFYDEKVILQIIKDTLDLHEQVADVLESAVIDALVDLTPIIRPLWWLDPNDIIAQSIKDEFLVSSTYLVAPIITLGLMSRKIYIPAGTWSDVLRGEMVVGPTWLYNYAVPLNNIAYFKLIK